MDAGKSGKRAKPAGRAGGRDQALIEDRELLSYGPRLASLESDFERLEDRFDKWTIAILGFAVTVALFGLGLAVSLFTTQGGGG